MELCTDVIVIVLPIFSFPKHSQSERKAAMNIEHIEFKT
jgi:hypothetical protein